MNEIASTTQVEIPLNGRGEPRVMLSRSAIALAAAGLLALLASGLLLAVNLWSATLPRGPIVSAVREGFADTMLQDKSLLRLNSDIGAHQFNDCLILLMAADDRAPALQRALAPTTSGAAILKSGAPPCPALRQLVDGKAPPLTPTDYYHRYVHGHVALIAGLLQVFSVRDLRVGFGALSFWLPASASIFALWRLMAMNIPPAARRTATAAAALIWGALLTTSFGEQYFGKSLAHFPSDCLFPLYVWGVLLLGRRLDSLFGLAAYNALFGVITMYFELLMGGAPIGASLVLTMTAAQLLDRPRGDGVWRIFVAIAAFGGGLVTLYGLKMAATAVVFGPDILGAAASRLAGYVGGPSALAGLIGLARNAEYFSGGNAWMGCMLVLAALVALAMGLRRMVFPRLSHEPAHWALVGAAMIAPAWWLSLRLSTWVHPWALGRFVIALIAPSLFLFLVLEARPIGEALNGLADRWRGLRSPSPD